MVNHYSCCAYVNIQAKLLKTRLILQTHVNLAIFGTNEGDYRRKKMF